MVRRKWELQLGPKTETLDELLRKPQKINLKISGSGKTPSKVFKKLLTLEEQKIFYIKKFKRI